MSDSWVMALEHRVAEFAVILGATMHALEVNAQCVEDDAQFLLDLSDGALTDTADSLQSLAADLRGMANGIDRTLTR